MKFVMKGYRKAHGMNRVEWTQKDQYIEYHVLKWPTSHLHPRERTAANAGVGLKDKPGGGAASYAQSIRQEGLGLGLADSSDRVRWRSGGLGADGMAQDGARETAHGREGDTLSVHQTEHRSQDLEAVSAAVQSAVPNETHNAVYGAAYRVGQAVQKIGGHVREATARLRDLYQRRQKQDTVPPRRNNTPTQHREQRGTRQISKDEVLTMQSENHYLLDSYDKNGQYSTLGK